MAADELRGHTGALLAEIEELAEATRAHVELGELRDPEAHEADGGSGDAAGSRSTPESGAGTHGAVS
jgi:hypothetical protein